jgi:hypothetical protein
MILGVLAKLWKATISFISVCPYIRMEQLGSHWIGFHEIWYLFIFRKSVEKIKVALKSDKNNFTLRPVCIFYPTSLSSFQNEKCFSKTLYRKSVNVF